MVEKQRRCVYTKLDNGIHEFVILEPSKAAVNDMVAYIQTILDTTPDDAPPTCYIIDNSRVNALPIKYLRDRVRELNEYRSTTREPGRLAIIYEGIMGSLVHPIISLPLKNSFRFFKPTERDAAMQWLLKED